MPDDLDDLDDLDGMLRDDRPDPVRRTWPLALCAAAVIIAMLMWITNELVEWWTEGYCELFKC